MRAKDVVGQFGEDVAARHLQTIGLEVLDRNWRCDRGELDIVARDQQTLVFVEVKTRSGTGFGWPVEAVDRRKARRIRMLACRWILERRPEHRDELRFDVVSVLRRPPAEPLVDHLRGVL